MDRLRSNSSVVDLHQILSSCFCEGCHARSMGHFTFGPKVTFTYIFVLDQIFVKINEDLFCRAYASIVMHQSHSLQLNLRTTLCNDLNGLSRISFEFWTDFGETKFGTLVLSHRSQGYDEFKFLITLYFHLLSPLTDSDETRRTPLLLYKYQSCLTISVRMMTVKMIDKGRDWACINFAITHQNSIGPCDNPLDCCLCLLGLG